MERATIRTFADPFRHYWVIAAGCNESSTIRHCNEHSETIPGVVHIRIRAASTETLMTTAIDSGLVNMIDRRPDSDQQLPPSNCRRSTKGCRRARRVVRSRWWYFSQPRQGEPCATQRSETQLLP